MSNIESVVPGLKVVHAIVTPNCRRVRGLHGAFEEAVRRLRKEYLTCDTYDCNAKVDYHVVITLVRHEQEANKEQ